MWQGVNSNLKTEFGNGNSWREMEFSVNSKIEIHRCRDVKGRMWDLSLVLESHHLGHELR